MSEKFYNPTLAWDMANDHEAMPSTIFNQYLPYKTDGFFVEFGMGGTLDPDTGLPCASNTGDFADLGWSGAYFEALERNCVEGTKRHENNGDRIQIYNYAIGDKYGQLPMYPGDTLIPELHIQYDKMEWLPEDYKLNYGFHMIDIIPPAKALEVAKCPFYYDVLSVDIEGYELRVMKEYNFKQARPLLAIIELRVNNEGFPKKYKVEGLQVVKIMLDNGYRIVHQDAANFWFMDTQDRPEGQRPRGV